MTVHGTAHCFIFSLRPSAGAELINMMYFKITPALYVPLPTELAAPRSDQRKQVSVFTLLFCHLQSKSNFTFLVKEISHKVWDNGCFEKSKVKPFCFCCLSAVPARCIYSIWRTWMQPCDSENLPIFSQQYQLVWLRTLLGRTVYFSSGIWCHVL